MSIIDDSTPLDGASPEKLAFSVEEVATMLSVGRTMVFELMRTGQLGSVKLGSRRVITRLDLDEFVNRARAEAQGDR